MYLFPFTKDKCKTHLIAPSFQFTFPSVVVLCLHWSHSVNTFSVTQSIRHFFIYIRLCIFCSLIRCISLAWFDGLPFIFKLTSISFIGFRSIVSAQRTSAKKCKKQMVFDKINLQVSLISKTLLRRERRHFDWFENKWTELNSENLFSISSCNFHWTCFVQSALGDFIDFGCICSVFATEHKVRKPYKLNKLKTLLHLNWF